MSEEEFEEHVRRENAREGLAVPWAGRVAANTPTDDLARVVVGKPGLIDREALVGWLCKDASTSDRIGVRRIIERDEAFRTVLTITALSWARKRAIVGERERQYKKRKLREALSLLEPLTLEAQPQALFPLRDAISLVTALPSLRTGPARLRALIERLLNEGGIPKRDRRLLLRLLGRKLAFGPAGTN